MFSETTKATLGVFAICAIVWLSVIFSLTLIYPSNTIEIDTTGMSAEEIRLLELWMEN